MKLTFILGNGFDIALGLKTRYTDFYDAFLAKETSTFDNQGIPIIHHPELVDMLKQNKDYTLWADLELLLGKSIKSFRSIGRLREEKIHLENSLNAYIREEQKRLIVNDDRCHEIRQALDELIIKFFEYFNWTFNDEEKIDVQFVTFNYSNTIERIVGAASKTAGIQNIKYEKTLYIHGKIDDRFILGVDNESQYSYITNDQTWSNNKDEVKIIMEKPQLNISFRTHEYNEVVRAINDADKIIIYGTSVGETDDSWWKMISKWLVIHNDYSFHQLGVLFYLKDSNCASITALTPLEEVEKKFERLAIKTDRTNLDTASLHRGAIEVKRTEGWMFSFDKDIISISSERLFPGLTLNT